MPRVVLALVLFAVSCGGEQVTANPGAEDVPTTTTAVSTTIEASVSTTLTATTTATTPPRPSTFVVWMREGLPPEFHVLAASVAGVQAVTIGRSGTLHIAETRSAQDATVDLPPSRFVIPVEGLALERDTYTHFVDPATAEMLDSLGPNQVILGASSAKIRRLGVGGRIILEGGEEKTVAAVLDDDAVGFAEVIAVTDQPFLIEDSERRWALIDYDGNAEELLSALGKVLPEDTTIRVRARGGADEPRRRTVRPQVIFKKVFGEFAYRPTSRGRFVIDPQWKEQNIVSVWIPLLGRADCHRLYAELLTEVMQGLIDDGLRNVINPDRFRGCWVARYIGGSTRISRHAWGAAADINFGGSLSGGRGSPVNQELLDRMAAVGVVSGHTWTTPDPGHFEYYGLDETARALPSPEFLGD